VGCPSPGLGDAGGAVWTKGLLESWPAAENESLAKVAVSGRHRTWQAVEKGARRELLSVIHYLRQDSEMARARWRQ
jgi:hypothetical protein